MAGSIDGTGSGKSEETGKLGRGRKLSD